MPARVLEFRTVGPIAVLTMVLAACSSGSAATTMPTSQPSPTTPVATPSAAPSPIPTIQPSPSLAVLPNGGSVGPGNYATLFQPAMTLTLDVPAESFVDIPGWINVGFEGDAAPEIHIVRLDKLFDPKHPKNLIDPPKDLAAWFANLPGLAVVAPARAVQIGGLGARQLDLRTGEKGVSFGPIPGLDDPSAGVGPGDTFRLIVVPVNGRQVVFWMHAEAGHAPFEVSMEAMQPLLDSIVWH